MRCGTGAGTTWATGVENGRAASRGRSVNFADDAVLALPPGPTPVPVCCVHVPAAVQKSAFIKSVERNAGKSADTVVFKQPAATDEDAFGFN